MSARKVLIVEANENLISLLVSLCRALGFEPEVSAIGPHRFVSAIRANLDVVRQCMGPPSREPRWFGERSQPGNLEE